MFLFFFFKRGSVIYLHFKNKHKLQCALYYYNLAFFTNTHNITINNHTYYTQTYMDVATVGRSLAVCLNRR